MPVLFLAIVMSAEVFRMAWISTSPMVVTTVVGGQVIWSGRREPVTGISMLDTSRQPDTHIDLHRERVLCHRSQRDLGLRVRTNDDARAL